MIRALAVFVLACACGGGGQPAVKSPPPPPPDPIPATAGPDCKAVADQIANLALEDHSQHAQVVEQVTARCTEDAWSDEARSCLATAESEAELQGCVEQKLTEAQRTALESVALETKSDAAAAEPAGSPPPDKPKRRTRGVTKKKPPAEGADPCMGGEVTDPCMGGE